MSAPTRQTLLVATDLSARSDRALGRAVRLAREQAAALTVLHVVDAALPETARRSVAEAAEREIAAALSAQRAADDPTVAIRIVIGNPFREIVEAAEAIDSALVVLGRHRNESCDAAFGGTTMGRVIRTGTRPVLVATDLPKAAYRRVLVGVDFSDHSRDALRMAATIAPGATITALHAWDVPFAGFLPGGDTQRHVRHEHERALSLLIAETLPGLAGAPCIEPLLREGEVTGVLREETDRMACDLLVVGTHGRTGLADAVLGSVARDLIDRPPCDVLAVKRAAT